MPMYIYIYKNEKLGKTPWKSRTINYSLVAVWLKSIIFRIHMPIMSVYVCKRILWNNLQWFSLMFRSWYILTYKHIPDRIGIPYGWDVKQNQYYKHETTFDCLLIYICMLVFCCKKVFMLLFSSHKSLWTNLLFPEINETTVVVLYYTMARAVQI